jgi:hypothetical protein
MKLANNVKAAPKWRGIGLEVRSHAMNSGDWAPGAAHRAAPVASSRYHSLASAAVLRLDKNDRGRVTGVRRSSWFSSNLRVLDVSDWPHVARRRCIAVEVAAIPNSGLDRTPPPALGG